MEGGWTLLCWQKTCNTCNSAHVGRILMQLDLNGTRRSSANHEPKKMMNEERNIPARTIKLKCCTHRQSPSQNSPKGQNTHWNPARLPSIALRDSDSPLSPSFHGWTPHPQSHTKEGEFRERHVGKYEFGYASRYMKRTSAGVCPVGLTLINRCLSRGTNSGRGATSRWTSGVVGVSSG